MPEPVGTITPFAKGEFILVAPFLKGIDVMHVARACKFLRCEMIQHLLFTLLNNEVFHMGGPPKRSSFLTFEYWCRVQRIKFHPTKQPAMVSLPPSLCVLIWGGSPWEGLFLPLRFYTEVHFPSTLRELIVNSSTFLNYSKTIPTTVQKLQWTSKVLPDPDWFAGNHLQELRVNMRVQWTQAHVDQFPFLREWWVRVKDLFQVDLSVLSSLLHLHLIPDHDPYEDSESDEEDENYLSPVIFHVETSPWRIRLPPGLVYLCAHHVDSLEWLDWEQIWPTSFKHLCCYSLTPMQVCRLDHQLSTLCCHSLSDSLPLGVTHVYTIEMDKRIDLSEAQGLVALDDQIWPNCARWMENDASDAHKRCFHIKNTIRLPEIPEGTLSVYLEDRKQVPTLPTTLTTASFHHMSLLTVLDAVDVCPRLESLLLYSMNLRDWRLGRRFPSSLRSLTIYDHPRNRFLRDLKLLTFSTDHLENLNLFNWKQPIGSLTHLIHLRRFTLEFDLDYRKLEVPTLPASLEVFSFGGKKLHSGSLPPHLRKLSLASDTRFLCNSDLPRTLTKVKLNLSKMELDPLTKIRFPFVTDLCITEAEKMNLEAFPHLHTLRFMDLKKLEECIQEDEDIRRYFRTPELARPILFPNSVLNGLVNLPTSSLTRVVFYGNCRDQKIWLCD